MNDLTWLQPYWLQLAQTIKQQRIPQALLISGNQGLGKQALASHWAQALLCFSRNSAAEYCGKCQSCRLFVAQTHPDYRLLEPEATGKAIAIAVIRKLTTQMTLKPHFNSQRVLIINPADALSHAAANAFLKYLEEPSERTTLILIAEKPSKLPATIRSRCQKLFIASPSKSSSKAWLKQHNLEQNAELALSLANGSPLLAKQFLEQSVLALRKQCFEHWMQLGTQAIGFNEVAETWSKLEKSEMDYLLFWLLGWVMDLIKLAYHRQAPSLHNPDLTPVLCELSEKLDVTDLHHYYDFLVLSQKRIDTQLNKQLMFEEILIRWLALNNN